MDAARIKAEMIKDYNHKNPLKVGGKQSSGVREIKQMHDGCQYKGNTNKNGKREGYGEAWWPDGRYYQG